MNREADIEIVKSVLNDFTYNLKHNLNFAFTKYGDGEAICMSNKYTKGMTNCDGQSYSRELSDKLFDAAHYFNRNMRAFIGEWSEEPHATILKQLLKEKDIFKITYVSYCTLLHVYEECLNHSRKFYLTIKDSARKKYYVGNKNMKFAASWLGCEFIEIPSSEAYNEYDNVRTKLLKTLSNNNIYLYSAGLMSKVLIHDLMSVNEETTHLDVGSGLDNVFVCYTREKQIDTMYLKQFYGIPL